jgi:hypothetical protein
MRAVPPEALPASGADGSGDGSAPVDPALVRQIAELRGRLRPVCRDWGEAEFEAVVHRIARRKVRWDEAGP